MPRNIDKIRGEGLKKGYNLALEHATGIVNAIADMYYPRDTRSETMRNDIIIRLKELKR